MISVNQAIWIMTIGLILKLHLIKSITEKNQVLLPLAGLTFVISHFEFGCNITFYSIKNPTDQIDQVEIGEYDKYQCIYE